MLLTYKTILSQKTKLTSDVYLYHFNLIEPKEINFTAGQYLVIKIPVGGNQVSRLYSIASPVAEKNNFKLIIKIITGGLASGYLSDLKVGDEAIFQGPAGTFILKENDRQKIFLTTGTGIAPVKSILDSYKLPLNSHLLFWGLKTYEDIYLFDELKKFNLKICLSREPSLDIIPENDKKYFILGRIDSSFNQFIENCLPADKAGKIKIENLDFYLCGGRQTVESLRLFLLGKRVLKENIYFEKF